MPPNRTSPRSPRPFRRTRPNRSPRPLNNWRKPASNWRKGHRIPPGNRATPCRSRRVHPTQAAPWRMVSPRRNPVSAANPLPCPNPGRKDRESPRPRDNAVRVSPCRVNPDRKLAVKVPVNLSPVSSRGRGKDRPGSQGSLLAKVSRTARDSPTVKDNPADPARPPLTRFARQQTPCREPRINCDRVHVRVGNAASRARRVRASKAILKVRPRRRAIRLRKVVNPVRIRANREIRLDSPEKAVATRRALVEPPPICESSKPSSRSRPVATGAGSPATSRPKSCRPPADVQTANTPG